MRLDKYLKTARILKRRTVSKELADQERVYVNGKIAKPSTDVKVGDTIKVIFGYRELTVNVTTEAGIFFVLCCCSIPRSPDIDCNELEIRRSLYGR